MSIRAKITGERIRECRKRAGLTQKQLAEIIERTESSIAKYERGLVEIPIYIQVKIADALDVPAGYISGLGMEEISLEDERFSKLLRKRNDGRLSEQEQIEFDSMNAERIEAMKSGRYVIPGGGDQWHADEALRLAERASKGEISPGYARGVLLEKYLIQRAGEKWDRPPTKEEIEQLCKMIDIYIDGMGAQTDGDSE